MAGYHFDEELFKTNFKAKESGTKSEDSAWLNHVPDKCFKLIAISLDLIPEGKDIDEDIRRIDEYLTTRIRFEGRASDKR